MKRIILIVCLLGGWILPAVAQYYYTLQQCLEEGLANNYLLRITRNEEQISKNNATLANAGYLPTVDLSAGYTGTVDNTDSKLRESGVTETSRGVFDQTLNAGIDLNWTVFDGFNISTTYKQLAEYYNYIQQEIRLKNFRYAVSLSKERLRIVEERYHIGNFSRLDYQQAKVDFNADSAQYMKQQELVHTSRINLNELMAVKDVDRPIRVKRYPPTEQLGIQRRYHRRFQPVRRKPPTRKTERQPGHPQRTTGTGGTGTGTPGGLEQLVAGLPEQSPVVEPGTPEPGFGQGESRNRQGTLPVGRFVRYRNA